MTLTALTTLIAAVTTTGLGLVANLQEKVPGTPGAKAGIARKAGKHALMGRFSEEIGLTDGQKAQIQALREKARAEMQGLGSQGSPDARRAAWKEMRSQYREQFQNILSPDQKAKLEALKAETKAKMAERRAAFEKELGLTELQKAEIARLKAEMKSKVTEFKSKGTLDRKAIRAEMQSFRAKLDSVLTAEQRAKIAEARKSKHGKRSRKSSAHGTSRPVSV
ncbi:MAG: hypothetical protein IT207_06860 [Fimbriimonadaceae bacterium]|nr:hypothetical protein [Fimbriimonadaceae bacterium]